MEILKTQKSCLLFFLVVLSFSICPGQSIPPAGTTETTTNQQQAPSGVPQTEGNNAPLLPSPPNDAPINKIPFAKPVGNGNQGQQSQTGYQRQQEPNYPQQSINQPLSGYNQPYSTVNQPYSGLNQPFSNYQPFGATNQQGSVENAAFDNGVSKENACIQGVVLVSLVTSMVSFGFLV
ncbi:hypothetical protein QUC31_000327 [Theobroma cacao]|uniref:Uncharacterized protein LOC18591563 n=2 Tax=Theobroma cacao TaxID=3641 RepID=A0AB32UUF7_THECC|nr:PREDICTED: uncharacterized protein LOC18591563 [Theobroma cacao]EOY15038.1 Uncharacterized protein TCM_034235 [Theobroma cacao]